MNRMLLQIGWLVVAIGVGTMLLGGSASSATIPASQTVIIPGKSIGPLTIGMEWSVAKKIFSRFGPFEERVAVGSKGGKYLRSSWGTMSDFVFYFDNLDEPKWTFGKVALIGTTNTRFLLKGTLKVGSPVSEIFAAYGRPNSSWFAAYQWTNLGLQIRVTEGKVERIEMIAVFVPRK